MQQKRNMEAVLYGTEPDYLPDHDYKVNLILLLNWYSSAKSTSDAKKWLMSYTKKNLPHMLPEVSGIKESEIKTTYGWLSRILLRGIELQEETIDRLHEYITSIVRHKDDGAVDNNTAKPKSSRSETIEERKLFILGELEGLADEYYLSGKSLNVSGFLKAREIPLMYYPTVALWCREKIELYEGIIADKELMEGDGQSKPFYNRLLKELNAEYAKLDSTPIKKPRKPRKTKVKSPTEIVKDVKYCVEGIAEYGLKSLEPALIVGASQVIVYNRKYHQLIVYEAVDKLTVKGTTIIGFDDKKSMCKRIRNPEKVLTEASKSSKLAIRKLMKNQKTKEEVPTGRLNSDCLILKIN